MSDTDKSELEEKLQNIWAVARQKARLDLGDPHKYVEEEVLALITQQCNQARIDERTQVYYVAHDILADKKIPRHAALEYFKERMENE